MLQNLWLSPNFTDTCGKRGRGTGKEVLERPFSRQLMLVVILDTSLRGGASPRSAGPRSSSGDSAGTGVSGGTTSEQELFWRYIISSTESSSLEATVPLQLAELNSSSWQKTLVQSVKSTQVRPRCNSQPAPKPALNPVLSPEVDYTRTWALSIFRCFRRLVDSFLLPTVWLSGCLKYSYSRLVHWPMERTWSHSVSAEVSVEAPVITS